MRKNTVNYDDIVCLLKENTYQDAIGQVKKEYIKREVFANKKSISQKEFFATRSDKNSIDDMRSSFCFEINLLDYEDESILEYNSKMYKIYRMFAKDEILELYCEERAGVVDEN